MGAMKAVVQRVASARVDVEGKTVASCGVGLLVLAAVHRDDTPAQAQRLADRICGLRIFNDAAGKMNLAIGEVERAAILAVSNFTVYGETVKNRRPSFVESAPYEQGRELFEEFVQALRSFGCRVETGVFGAMMNVVLANDGPVTVIVEVPPASGNVVR